jgi:predicted polyphosphate/ATP-dependent NAD kinase
MKQSIGLIVNPIAGLGGSVGLKGTDRPDLASRARALGAEPRSPSRAVETLLGIASSIAGRVELLAAPHEMGEDETRQSGLEPTVVGANPCGATSAKDTRRAAHEMLAAGIDLLVFAGGDGTARDIYDAVADRVPVLGIPTGVKIHSAAFARHPRAAADLIVRFLSGQLVRCREAEVMDIDEDAVRAGRVSARLYGYVRVPDEPRLVQGLKASSVAGEDVTLASIAADVVERMEKDWLYILGPGTTTRAVTNRLGVSKTLLGVDVVRNGDIVAADVNEQALLRLLAEYTQAKVVVTPIGGQGYLFGRGNQQISPAVLERLGRDNVIIIATSAKLASLGGGAFLVDTGDRHVDGMLAGFVRVVTGYKTEAVYPVAP